MGLGRPVALELSTRQLERSGSWQGQLQTSAEEAFLYTVLKHLEMFQDDTLYKFTFLLTYLPDVNLECRNLVLQSNFSW